MTISVRNIPLYQILFSRFLGIPAHMASSEDRSSLLPIFSATLPLLPQSSSMIGHRSFFFLLIIGSSFFWSAANSWSKWNVICALKICLDGYRRIHEETSYSENAWTSKFLIIPGQQKLSSSSVLLIGAGGLGCPVALYCAGAGSNIIQLLNRVHCFDFRLSIQLGRRWLYPLLALHQVISSGTQQKAAVRRKIRQSSLNILNHVCSYVFDNFFYFLVFVFYFLFLCYEAFVVCNKWINS